MSVLELRRFVLDRNILECWDVPTKSALFFVLEDAGVQMMEPFEEMEDEDGPLVLHTWEYMKRWVEPPWCMGYADHFNCVIIVQGGDPGEAAKDIEKEIGNANLRELTAEHSRYRGCVPFRL